MKPKVEDIKPGGWVKLVNGETVINGTVKSVTATYIKLENLYPLPLKYWIPIIVTSPVGKP